MIAECMPAFPPVPVPQKSIKFHSISIGRSVAGGGCVRENGENPAPCRNFPRTTLSRCPLLTPTAMSTDQRASERVGELIHHAFESLLQANTALERLQDLIGLGMDLKQLMAPHSQSTWRFMVPQEQRFRENWKKFISTVEGVESIASHPQQAAVGATEPAPTPLPATTAQTPVEALTVRQNKV